MCIRTARTSSLYGTDVVLEGLKSAGMNDEKEVVGGFDPDTDRRSVYNPELKKGSLDLASEYDDRKWQATEENLNLVDGPDRFDGFPLMPDRCDVSLYHSLRQTIGDIKQQIGNEVSVPALDVLNSCTII